MDLIDLMQIAPTSRRSDPVTSREAAAKAEMRATENRMLVLLNLIVRPMSDFDLAEATGRLATSIGKRRHDCMTAGLVEQALDGRGEPAFGKTPTGSRCMIWAITQAGRAYYAEHSREAA